MEVSFQVDTEEMDSLIRYISQFGIVKLESAPPTLEDLFMRHYQGEESILLLEWGVSDNVSTTF